MDIGLIGGPNHGSFVPCGTARRACAKPARPRRHRSSRSEGAMVATSAAASSTKVVIFVAASRSRSSKRPASVAALVETSSVQVRCAIWWAMVQPSAGVERAQSAASSGATRRSRSAHSASKSASSVSRSAMTTAWQRAEINASTRACIYHQPKISRCTPPTTRPSAAPCRYSSQASCSTEA